MVTTKQHPIVDTQKIKETKHINKESQQTIKERAREDTPCKWKPKESCGSYTYFRQNRFQKKDCNNNKTIT